MILRVALSLVRHEPTAAPVGLQTAREWTARMKAERAQRMALRPPVQPALVVRPEVGYGIHGKTYHGD